MDKKSDTVSKLHLQWKKEHIDITQSIKAHALQFSSIPVLYTSYQFQIKLGIQCVCVSQTLGIIFFCTVSKLIGHQYKQVSQWHICNYYSIKITTFKMLDWVNHCSNRSLQLPFKQVSDRLLAVGQMSAVLAAGCIQLMQNVTEGDSSEWIKHVRKQNIQVIYLGLWHALKSWT